MLLPYHYKVIKNINITWFIKVKTLFSTPIVNNGKAKKKIPRTMALLGILKPN